MERHGVNCQGWACHLGAAEPAAVVTDSIHVGRNFELDAPRRTAAAGITEIPM